MRITRSGILLSILSLFLCMTLTGCMFLPGDLDELGDIFEEDTEETDGEEETEETDQTETVVEDHEATPEDFLFDEADPTRLIGVADKTCFRYEIPEGTKTIGEYAFFDCTYAREILLPESVTVLEYGAFRDCLSLERINFPSALTRIEGSAFEACSRLEEAVLPESVSYIGDYAFDGCGSIRELVIPPDAEVDGESAFDGCCPKRVTLPVSMLEYVDLHDALTVVLNGGESIHLNLLSTAEHMTSLTLPETLREVEGFQFYNSKLVEIYNFSEALISRSESNFAFGAIEIYTSPEEESRLFWDGDFLFYEHGETRFLMGYAGAGTEMLVLPEACHGSTYEVYDFALRDLNTRVEGLTVPTGVTKIGDYAFEGLPISSIAFSENGRLERLGESAFENTELVDLTLPASLRTVGSSAFGSCTSLRRVSFAENSALAFIGSYAFAGCRLLEYVMLPAGVENVYVGAFEYCTRLYEVCNLSATVTKGNVGDHGGLFDHALLIHNDPNAESPFVVTNENFRFFCSENGCVLVDHLGEDVIPALPETIEGKAYEIAPYAFHYDSYASFPAEYRIPDGVTAIGEYAFCSAGIEELTVGAGVREIGAGAFSTMIEMHTLRFAENSQLTRLGFEAFGGCTALTEVALPATLVTLEGSAFFNCIALQSVTLLGDALETIGDNAFVYCESLRSFRIPASVTRIEVQAFSGCTSLEELVFECTYGWAHAYEWEENLENYAAVAPEELADAANASRLLSEEYCDHVWVRTAP